MINVGYKSTMPHRLLVINDNGDLYNKAMEKGRSAMRGYRGLMEVGKAHILDTMELVFKTFGKTIQSTLGRR